MSMLRDEYRWSEEVLENTVSEAIKSCPMLNSAESIPSSSLTGENFVELSKKSPWYAGRFTHKGDEIVQPGSLVSIIDGSYGKN